MHPKKQEKEFNPKTLTSREQELLSLFRVLTESDRRLLLFAAKKMILSSAKKEKT
jgi:hypothetical protein